MSQRRRHRSPRYAGPAPSRFVRVGHKEVYDPTNPADVAEYRTVLSYRQY